MPDFAVTGSERFPSTLSGILVPDDGHELHFHDEIENYYGCQDPLVAVFVSEFVAGHEAQFLTNATELARLETIVTFGRQRDSSKLGTTHLDVVARDLALPILRLQMPDEYPSYDKASSNYHTWLDEVHIPGWIRNNPLKRLYHETVQIDLVEERATIVAAG